MKTWPKSSNIVFDAVTIWPYMCMKVTLQLSYDANCNLEPCNQSICTTRKGFKEHVPHYPNVGNTWITLQCKERVWEVRRFKNPLVRVIRSKGWNACQIHRACIIENHKGK